MPQKLKPGSFGLELVLNLYGCNVDKITDKKCIQDFVVKLCAEVIDMKRFGKPLIVSFGHKNKITSGYSLVQLIETSSVTAHFSDWKKAVYINIFSCKWFDRKAAAEFCKEWFGAKKMTVTELDRP